MNSSFITRAAEKRRVQAEINAARIENGNIYMYMYTNDTCWTRVKRLYQKHTETEHKMRCQYHINDYNLCVLIREDNVALLE